ncbi:AlpA family phage regulatory protein [Nitrospirillum amazonense]|nr:AlpA family phage regulatory protein [Nitrospirillum amazonense]MEC4591768.1 AlpA family phage regulatory protein [Nitrospirillum amazonense]
MGRRGEFPQRFYLTSRYVVWDLAKVEAWLNARRAAPIRRAQHPNVTKRRARHDPNYMPARAETLYILLWGFSESAGYR